jgi:hypothetical protein
MAMFKIAVAAQFKMVLMVFLLGSAFRLVPANPNNACGCDLRCRVFYAHQALVLYASSAAILLFMVWKELRIAEAAARAARGGARAVDADRVGIGSIAAAWTRRWLRGALLGAVVLSFAASVLAVVTFEDGVLYRTGCLPDNHDGPGSLLGVLLMGLFALVHGFFAWVAVTEN